MAETTTTTTVDDTTTTTTVEGEDTTTTTTVEKQGEVIVDKSADAHVLREQSQEERLEGAKQDALANHQAEHANDNADTTPASNDKPDGA